MKTWWAITVDKTFKNKCGSKQSYIYTCKNEDPTPALVTEFNSVTMYIVENTYGAMKVECSTKRSMQIYICTLHEIIFFVVFFFFFCFWRNQRVPEGRMNYYNNCYTNMHYETVCRNLQNNN